MPRVMKSESAQQFLLVLAALFNSQLSVHGREWFAQAVASENLQIRRGDRLAQQQIRDTSVNLRQRMVREAEAENVATT
jgi:hypothetical protein